MSSYSFRDRPRLSDRIRGKSGDELFRELRKELDQDRKSFFDSPPSNWGSSTGSSFPRAGHLFEEPLIRGHTDIRSHLEDLAQRHPEFADQLRYPAWSNGPENNTGTWGRKRRGSGPHEPGEASKQHPQDPTGGEGVEEPGPLRGRAKDNLRNTVPDMGQKQQQDSEDKETRGQRSWSAPPDNRTQPEKPRFVSKIEIHPVNPDAPPQSQSVDATKPPMAPPKPQPQSQPQQQPKSNVRHIPIFVEGRDEPVRPKNVEPEFTQSQAPPQSFWYPPDWQHTQPPQAQQPPFTQQPQYTQEHFQAQAPPYYEPPHTYGNPQFTQQHFQQAQAPPPQPRYEQPQTKQEPPPNQQQPQPEPQPDVNPRDPLYRVGCVQKEVEDLKTKVENFNGNSRSDKDYILLDELLTRNLIKLDDIETEGKDEVRTARKNTIRNIQRCISILENKVPLPGSEKKQGESMEVDPKSLEGGVDMVSDKADVHAAPQEAVPSEQTPVEKSMEEASEAGNTNASEVPPGVESNSQPSEGKQEESSSGAPENKEA